MAWRVMIEKKISTGVEPGAPGGREVQGDPGILSKPGPDPGVVVGGVVVADHVQLLAGPGGGHLLQEAQELLMAVPGVAGVHHPAGLGPYRARRWRRQQVPWSLTDRGPAGLRRILECQTDGSARSGRWFTTM
jgi:hypothetical protein